MQYSVKLANTVHFISVVCKNVQLILGIGLDQTGCKPVNSYAKSPKPLYLKLSLKVSQTVMLLQSLHRKTRSVYHFNN